MRTGAATHTMRKPINKICSYFFQEFIRDEKIVLDISDVNVGSNNFRRYLLENR